MVRDSRRRGNQILTATAITLAVTAVVTGTISYRNVHQPQGSAPTGMTPIPACALDESLQQQTHTHNFEHASTYGAATNDTTAADFNAECLWKQTEGIDGVDARSLKLYLARFDGPDGARRAQSRYRSDQTPPYTLSAHKVSDAAGIGDEASFAVAANSTATEVSLLARQGNRLVGVNLEGGDHQFFWHKPMSAEEGKRVTELIARELLRRNW